MPRDASSAPWSSTPSCTPLGIRGRVTRRDTKRRVQATAEKRALVVLDIPLLYETKAESTVSECVCVGGGCV